LANGAVAKYRGDQSKLPIAAPKVPIAGISWNHAAIHTRNGKRLRVRSLAGISVIASRPGHTFLRHDADDPTKALREAHP
jgi:hypothetical protein